MPFEGKDETLCAQAEEEEHVLLSHSFELSKSISGRDCVSVEKELATNIARMN